MRIKIEKQYPSPAHIMALQSFLREHRITHVWDHDQEEISDQPFLIESLTKTAQFCATRGMKIFRIFIEFSDDDIAAECLLRFT